MINSQLGYWLILAGFVAVPLLLSHQGIRRLGRRRLDDLGAWVLAQVDPVPEPDPLAQELHRALRRERLRADIVRLQRLLATDMTMSATRQLGNRLAHEWLMRDLRSLGGAAPSVAATALDVEAPSMVRRPVEVTVGSSWHRGPEVEVLEIGWRR